MPRSIILGNGETLIALDKFARVGDFYFPHIGLDNHVGKEFTHGLGVWVDGKISWFGEDKNWNIEIKSEESYLASSIKAENTELELTISFNDFLCNKQNIFIRSINIHNQSKRSRDIKFYFSHKFHISKSRGGDSALFDQKNHTILHYKGNKVFLINGEIDGEPFSDYEIGSGRNKSTDKNDKVSAQNALSKNPVGHGETDSLICFHSFFSPNESKKINYWIIAAHSISEAQNINTSVLKKTPESIIKMTSDFGKSLFNKYNFDFHKLTPEVISLFKKSLIMLHAHLDKGGGLIASADSEILNQDKDFYSYVWPRDAAFSAIAFSSVGNEQDFKKIFEFFKTVINKEGYFVHKFLPDKSLGSSSRPSKDLQFRLPIEEDETAIVVWSLYDYYKKTHNIEYIESIYDEIVERAADFMVEYRNTQFRLPKPSYDIWGEKFSTSTYTSASVYGALMVSSEFSRLLGKIENAKKYKEVAQEIKKGILNYLYDKNSGNFFKSITYEGGSFTEDKTIDMSSVFGIFLFGVLPANDHTLERAMNQTVGALSNNIKGLGLARYFGDDYHKIPGNTPGNPWFVSTLWYVQYLIARSQSEKEFIKVRVYLEWVAKHSLISGVLSEQVNPFNGEQVSVSPLVWSHAEFVNTIKKYLDRLEELGVCKTRKAVS